MTNDDKKLSAALKFDALDTAEHITGKSYKQDAGTMWLGALAMMDNGRVRTEMLRERGDSTFSNNLSDYQRIVEAEGFELCYEEPFKSPWEHGDETLFMYFHARDGILLKFDTFYGRKSVNGGNFYYNWTANERDHPYGITSSGKWDCFGDEKKWGPHWILAGDHDCREAIRFHIAQLREHGKFVTPWKSAPHLWLFTFADKFDYHSEEHKATKARRLEALPEKVRAAIAVVT